MKNEAIVYPYSIQFAPIVRFLRHQGEFDIISAVMPGYWYKNGVDASFVDEGDIIGIPIIQDFESEMSICETVIWADYAYSSPLFRSKVCKQMQNAIKNGKSIYCCQQLSEEEYKSFKDLDTQGRFQYCVNQKTVFDEDRFRSDDAEADEIDTPIITVMGLSENCQKMETQLYLRRMFEKNGYKILQIGTRNYCEFLGFHSFPQFMGNLKLSETEKVIRFKSYIKYLEKTERPNIIIIGIPGGICNISKNLPSDFGITAYEVLSAVSSDYNILMLWNEMYNDRLIGELKRIAAYRYNTNLDMICISNISLNKDGLLDKGHQIGYNIYSNSETENIIPSKVPANITGVRQQGSDQMFQRIIDSLSE